MASRGARASGTLRRRHRGRRRFHRGRPGDACRGRAPCRAARLERSRAWRWALRAGHMMGKKAVSRPGAVSGLVRLGPGQSHRRERTSWRVRRDARPSLQGLRHPLATRRPHDGDRLGRRPQGRLPARRAPRVLPVRRLPGTLGRDPLHRAARRPAAARRYRLRGRLRALPRVVRRSRQRHLLLQIPALALPMRRLPGRRSADRR